MTAPSQEHVTDESAPDVTWGLARPLVALALGVLGAGAGSGVAAAVTGAELDEATLATTVGSLVGMWTVYAAVIAFTVRTASRPFAALGLRLRAIDLVTGVAAGLLSSFVVVNLVYLVLRLTSVVDQEDLDRLSDPAERLDALAGGAGFVVLAAFVGIGAPVVEEVFFRGFLQRAAVRRLGVPGGIAFTAAVFGAVHFQVLQFPALAAFGLVLGVLAHAFGRLGPAIVAHVVFNGLTLLALSLT